MLWCHYNSSVENRNWWLLTLHSTNQIIFQTAWTTTFNISTVHPPVQQNKPVGKKTDLSEQRALSGKREFILWKDNYHHDESSSFIWCRGKHSDKGWGKSLNYLITLTQSSRVSCCQGTQPSELPVIPEKRGRVCNKSLTIQGKMVSNLLHQLDTYKSTGPEGIHTMVLREWAKALSELVSIIYQQSCLTREVPIDWSLANIIPI